MKNYIFCLSVVVMSLSIVNESLYAQQVKDNQTRVTATVLNSNIEFVNQLIRVTRKFPVLYHKYNVLLNRSSSEIPSFKVLDASFSLPVELYERALFENEKLPDLEKEILRIGLNDLWASGKALENTMKSFQNQENLTLDQVKENLLNFEQQHAVINVKYNQFYKTLASIDQIYRNRSLTSNFWKTQVLLKGSIEEARRLISIIKSKRQELKPSSIKLKEKLDQFQTFKQRNFKVDQQGGVKFETTYGNIKASLDEVAEMISRSEKKDFKWELLPITLEKLIIHFNKAVNGYNYLADLSFKDNEYTDSACLLKLLKEGNIYQYKGNGLKNEDVENIIDDTELGSMEGYANNHLILLLDISASMDRTNRLPLLRESLIKISKIMRPTDRLSIISYSDKPKILLKNEPFNESKLTTVLRQLKSRGETNFNKGLRLAYKLGGEYFSSTDNNRILVATDGEFKWKNNLNKLIVEQANSGILLSVFSFNGTTNNMLSLKKLASQGQGNFVAITPSNSNRKLLEELRSVKIEQEY